MFNTREQLLSDLLKAVVYKVEDIDTSLNIDPSPELLLRPLPIFVPIYPAYSPQATPAMATNDGSPEVEEVILSGTPIPKVSPASR